MAVKRAQLDQLGVKNVILMENDPQSTDFAEYKASLTGLQVDDLSPSLREYREILSLDTHDNFAKAFSSVWKPAADKLNGA